MTDANSSYNSPVDFRITANPPALDGLDPPGAVVAIREIYSSIQQIIHALTDYCGIGPQTNSRWPLISGSSTTILKGNLSRFYTVASENIPYGAMISLWFNGGTYTQAHLANATDNTKICDGYCSTVGGVTVGAVGEFILGQGIISTSGLTIGQRYWLSKTSGFISTAPSVAAGNVEQYIGIAIDGQHLYFNTGAWIQH